LARFLDKPDVIESFKDYNRKVELRILADWFNTGDESLFTIHDDEIKRLDLSRDVEGVLGTSVRDRGTLVLFDPDGEYRRWNTDSSFYDSEINYGYAEPSKLVIVQIKVDNSEWLNYFIGLITGLVPNRNAGEVSLEIDDFLKILQEKEAPDKLFLDEYEVDTFRGIKIKNVIMQLLDGINLMSYNESSLENLNDRIIHNFKGLSIFQALQKLLEMNNAYMYTKDGELYVNSKKFLTEQEANIIEVFTDEESGDNVENIFKIEERVSQTDIFNHITVEAFPWEVQNASEIVWIGGEDEVDTSEVYVGSDIETSQLQLIYSPLDYETYYDEIPEDQPTENVPIIENSVGVEFGDRFYTVGEGLDNVDYENGIITFTNSAEYPLPNADQQFTVLYEFEFNKLLPGNRRHFHAHLEYPCTDIKDIEDTLIFISEEDADEDYEVESSEFNFTEIFHDNSGSFTIDTNKFTAPENIEGIRAKVQGRIISRGTIIPPIRTDRDWDLQMDLMVNNTSVQTFYTNSGEGTYDFHATSSWDGNVVQNDEVHLRFTGNIAGSYEHKLYVGPSLNDDIICRLDYHTKEPIDPTIDPDEPTDSRRRKESRGVSVFSHFWDDRQTVEVELINHTEKTLLLHSKVHNKREEAMVIVGYPIKQKNQYNVNKINDDSVKHFNIQEQLTISNDLFQSEDRMKELADFLRFQYSIPRSKFTVDTQGYPHIELLDKVQLEEKYRDDFKEALIISIEDSFRNGDWEQRLILEEFDDSWEYEKEPGLPPIKPPDPPPDKVKDPLPVENLTAYVEHIILDDGTINAALYAEWDNPDNMYHEKTHIYLRKDGETWSHKGDTIGEAFEVKLMMADTYELAAVSENQNGERLNFEDAPKLNVEVTLKEAPDSVLWNLESIEWGADYIKLVWHPHPDPDFDQYEIREEDVGWGED